MYLMLFERKIGGMRDITQALTEACIKKPLYIMYMQYIFHILHPAMESFYVKGIEIMIFEFLSNEETIFS